MRLDPYASSPSEIAELPKIVQVDSNSKPAIEVLQLFDERRFCFAVRDKYKEKVHGAKGLKEDHMSLAIQYHSSRCADAGGVQAHLEELQEEIKHKTNQTVEFDVRRIYSSVLIGYTAILDDLALSVVKASEE
ncbi:hypothetical protein BB560_006872, partial [Smittium megazygosporum]